MNQTTALPALPPPPPPPRNPGHSSRVPAPEFATALYDFEAQVAGDLSFGAGDTIEIVQRATNEDEWWVGRCRGIQGKFPRESAISTRISAPKANCH
jgi:amphiphysin